MRFRLLPVEAELEVMVSDRELCWSRDHLDTMSTGASNDI
jgi:hypothetical protein